MTSTARLDTDLTAVELGFEQHRTELTAYCYRMLGSAFEAEDAVQETLVRAWRSFDGFEGRSAVRSWLYRIASNVCFDMLKGRKRRALPIDMTAVGHAEGHLDPPQRDGSWIGPVPDGRVITSSVDPAELAETRDSVRLAFVAALQHLPPRQRAVLILREVLRWKANEVAELLETTVVSVNSALQRARSTLADANVTLNSGAEPIDDAQRELLARYVDAFERFDIESLVKLLRDDATMQMPPWALWLRGSDEYAKWLRGPGSECRGSRLAAISANGLPAFAQWRRSPAGGFDAWAIHVVHLTGDRISHMDFFVDPNLFPLFDLPLHLDA